MKQTWFRPPAFRQFSLDADISDAPNRPDGIAARRPDGRAADRTPAHGAGQERTGAIHDGAVQPDAVKPEPEQSDAARPVSPASGGVQPDAAHPASAAQPAVSDAAHTCPWETAAPPRDDDAARPCVQAQRALDDCTRAEQGAVSRSAAHARQGTAARTVRTACRRMARMIDRHGYYIAVGICALMVFAGALIGTSGYAPSEEPEPTQLTGEQVSDVPATRPSAGDGLLGEDVSANAALEGDAAPHSLACWPLQGQVLTEHTLDALVYQSTLGMYATHAGIDIGGSAGQVVVACADGEVVRCWRESLLGNVVEVRGEDGVLTRYANLASLDQAREGMSVSAGDVLGAIGQSAMSESLMEPHLHFEVVVDGQSVPPEDWLPER